MYGNRVSIVLPFLMFDVADLEDGAGLLGLEPLELHLGGLEVQLHLDDLGVERRFTGRGFRK